MHLNPFDEEKILLRFGVLSDCHLGMDPARTMKSCKSFCAPFSIWRAQRLSLAIRISLWRMSVRSGRGDTPRSILAPPPIYYPQPEEQMPVEEQFVHLYTDQLLPNTPYQVRVTACDSWGNESVPLMWDFRTPKR